MKITPALMEAMGFEFKKILHGDPNKPESADFVDVYYRPGFSENVLFTVSDIVDGKFTLKEFIDYIIAVARNG